MERNWDDLRFFIAIAQAKSLVGAAKVLKVDETTVGRRLLALEATLKAKLFVRKKSGYSLTPVGLEVMRTMKPLEQELRNLRTRIEGSDQSLTGIVRLTLPETMANEIVIPKLAEFKNQYPNITPQVLSNAQTLNVSKREADIAIRMFRPTNHTLIAQKLGKLRFAFFVHSDAQALKTLLDYPDELATDAESACLKKLRKRFTSSVLLNNRYALLRGIQNGLGFGMIPEIMIEEDASLRRVKTLPVLDLDVWMVVHEDLKTNAKIRAVADFLKAAILPRLK